MKVKVFGYKLVEEKPIECLDEFKEHKRLRVFYHKGTKCICCNKIGTRLIKGEYNGQYHWDVYTDDLYPLTIDHRHPKAFGGTDDLENLDPMCAGCNKKKGCGDSIYPIRGHFCNWPRFGRAIPTIPEVGKIVYKKKDARKLRRIGKIIQITVDPNTSLPAFIVAGRPERMYPIHATYYHK